ncbi:MAG: hypothetical protein WCI95_05295 [bacterium]
MKWWLLCLGVLALVLLRNQPWDCLIGYDQAKQAYVSLEMVQDGHWWHQHLPTGLPATKPPLAGWLSAAIYPLMGGWWEGAWRAPSFLAFIGMLFILGRAAWRTGGEWAAFLAIAVFSMNMLTIRLATLVRTDMLLALTILWGGILIWQQIRDDRPWSATRRAAFALIVLAGCFTKGPVILVFLLVPLLVWRLVCWRRHESSPAWPGWWPWLVPTSLFIIWLVVGCLLDNQFFRMVVVKEFGTNFAAISVTDTGHITVGSRHFSMMLTYPLQLFHRLFPWSVAVALWVIVDRQGRRRLWSDAGPRWLVVWIGVALLLMSLVPNKRVDRIFPIVAPFALLVAHLIGTGTWAGIGLRNPRKVIGCLTIIAFLTWGGYTVYWQMDTRNQEKNEEIARRDLCRQVTDFARAARVDVKVVGPISDLNQSLLTYLRCTGTIDQDMLRDALAEGNAVLMPLPRDFPTNESGRVVVRSDRVTEAGCGYGLLIRFKVSE